MSIIDNFNNIKQEIDAQNIKKEIIIIAVSKTFQMSHIEPLISHGHKHFGENKVQEAEKKWLQTKRNESAIKLHMVGRLQSNKAKKAVEIFDYIHSLDSEKLALELDKRQKEKNKNINYFIQVNLGSEEQKGGIEVQNLKSFFNFCKAKTSLSILGLMAIPPNNNSMEKYFKKISELNKGLGLNHLSLGMSGDYIQAIKYGSTFVRIGSSIFGNRN